MQQNFVLNPPPLLYQQTLFLSSMFCGIFDQLGVCAVQFWGYIGRHTCIRVLGSNFFCRPGYVVNSCSLVLAKKQNKYMILSIYSTHLCE